MPSNEPVLPGDTVLRRILRLSLGSVERQLRSISDASLGTGGGMTRRICAMKLPSWAKGWREISVYINNE